MLCNSSPLFAPPLPCLKLLLSPKPPLFSFLIFSSSSYSCLTMLCSASALLCPNISSSPLCHFTLICLWMIKILKPIIEWYNAGANIPQQYQSQQYTANRLRPQISSVNNAKLVRTTLQISQIPQFTVHFEYQPGNWKIGQTQSANHFLSSTSL